MLIKGILSNIRKKANRRISEKLIRSEKRGGKAFTGTRKHPHKKSKLKSEIKIIAPKFIDLYKARNHTKTMDFIQKLEISSFQAIRSNATLRICFRETMVISAAAGILLLSTIEIIAKNHPSLKVTISRPPNSKQNGDKGTINVVHAVLQRIGFYKAIRLGPFKTKSFPHVDNWYIGSSTQVDGQNLADAIKITEDLGVKTSELYRSGIEAISNAVEHAYSGKVPTNKAFTLKKWWIFVGVIDSRLVILVCDRGHGIPETLPYTQSTKLLGSIKAYLANLYKLKTAKIAHDGDVAQIHAATLVQETRTKLGHRGKGGKDIKSFVKANNDARLIIFSNKGQYRFVKKNSKHVDLGYNNHHSIGGTIIEWSLPIHVD